MTGNKLTYGVIDHGVKTYISVCHCVCVCVFAGKWRPESDIVNSDRGHTPKHGSPRIGLLVQTVANCTCIHMKMCKIRCKYNIQLIRSRFTDQISNKLCSPNCGAQSPRFHVQYQTHKSSFSCYFSRSTFHSNQSHLVFQIFVLRQ